MTQFLSDKLRALSLISILFVLYIHSGFHSDEIEGMMWNYRCQEFISGMLGRCAVPLFYVISGYLLSVLCLLDYSLENTFLKCIMYAQAEDK